VFKRYKTTQGRQGWTCTGCGHHVHPAAETIFNKSSTSLRLWFHALYLMTSTRCGISAKQLERELGVHYKTAWRMFHLIRNELMVQDDEPLTGTIEMDEMYVGGKPRQSDRARWNTLPHSYQRRQAAQAWSHRTKTPVFGMVERGGKVAAHVVPSTRRPTMMKHIEKRIPVTERVITDSASIYKRLPQDGWENHDTIDHSARVYVSGDVHTNTIEGFWSLVKRGISGSHHSVSAKHLQGYLNEYVWRYNYRDQSGPAQFALLISRAACVRV